MLNQGQGFTPGSIQITDRSGATATIDLSQARTVDDVINDINSNSTVHVTASAAGDSFVLTDETGQTASNLKVSEVGGGTTAASLGLASVNSASNQATGSSVLSLFDGLPLSTLNQGLGVQFDYALPDLQVNFADGTNATVDFNQLPTVGTQASGTTKAANGKNAAVTFTAVNAGSDYAGVAVEFVDDSSVTAGHETVSYDSTNKILQFHIDAGHTTANDVIAALKQDSTATRPVHRHYRRRRQRDRRDQRLRHRADHRAAIDGHHVGPDGQRQDQIHRRTRRLGLRRRIGPVRRQLVDHGRPRDRGLRRQQQDADVPDRRRRRRPPTTSSMP